MEYYSAIKKGNFATYDNMDGLWGTYIKWNKKKIQIPYDLRYMWNLKQANKTGAHKYRGNWWCQRLGQ